MTKNDCMSNSTTMKEVAEVRIGNYQVTLDEEKISIIQRLSDCQGEIQQIQEMTDWLLDLCCDITPDDETCLKYLKYLKNIRGAFEYARTIDVSEKGGAL